MRHQILGVDPSESVTEAGFVIIVNQNISWLCLSSGIDLVLPVATVRFQAV